MPRPYLRYEPWTGRNPFSLTFRQLFNQVAEAAGRYCDNEPRLLEMAARQTDFEETGEGVARPEEFLARITTFINIGPNRWRYQAIRVSPRANMAELDPTFEDIQGGEPLLAVYNLAEFFNDGMGREGYGVDVDDTPEYTVTYLPIGKDPGSDPVIVMIHPFRGVQEVPDPDNEGEFIEQDRTFYFFEAANAIDVECETEP